MSEEDVEKALKPFGWAMGKEFWKIYYTDPMVFHLVNVIEALHIRIGELEGDIANDRKT